MRDREVGELERILEDWEETIEVSSVSLVRVISYYYGDSSWPYAEYIFSFSMKLSEKETS